jgi:DNA repair protein RadC
MSAAASPSAGVAYQPTSSWEPFPPGRGGRLHRPRARPEPGRLAELRERAAHHGPRLLEDAEALDLLIGGGPWGDVPLREFGSLPEVLGAPLADLSRAATPAAALRIKLVQDLARRLLERPLRRRTVLTCWSQVLDYLRATLVGCPREQFRVLFLDKKNRLIADESMGEGTVDHAPVYPREVVRRALERHASALVLAHNHPSGDPTPSSADVEMTRRVVEAARALGIAVHDHIVVGGEETASLRSLGLM